MSFDINPPSRNLSNVQASAKSQDGGAGNTGYFMRGQKEEAFVNLNEEAEDTFARETDEELVVEEVTIGVFLRKLVLDIAKKILSFFKKKKPKVPKED